MKQRVAIITGGTRGIGRGIALQLGRMGWTVAITYHRNETAASTLAEEITHHGGSCHLAKFDIRDAALREHFVTDVLERFGRIDVLVNNVGVDTYGTLFEMTLEDWELNQEIMLNAPFHLCKLVLPTMHTQQGGRIINIGASSKNYLTGGGGAFGIHKAALTVLTKTLALEEIRHGVTVNMVAPGSTHGAGSNPEEQRIPITEIPIGRRVTIDEVVEAILYFLSDHAAAVTGQVIGVNGGLST